MIVGNNRLQTLDFEKSTQNDSSYENEFKRRQKWRSKQYESAHYGPKVGIKSQMSLTRNVI